jgi:hypothetical protein
MTRISKCWERRGEREALQIAMLNERGSLSPLRGYRPAKQADLFVENCGNVFLVEPRTFAAREWLRANLNRLLSFQNTHRMREAVSFGASLILRKRDADILLQWLEPTTLRVDIIDYTDQLS